VPVPATLCPRASIVMWKMAAVRPLMDSSCTFLACVAARQLRCGPMLGLIGTMPREMSGASAALACGHCRAAVPPGPRNTFDCGGIRRSSDAGV
jgi:hypothetical protein